MRAGGDGAIIATVVAPACRINCALADSEDSTGLTASRDRISDMGKSWAARQAAFQGE